LSAAQAAPFRPVLPDDLRGTPLDRAVSPALALSPGRARVLAVAHPVDGARALPDALVDALSALPGVRVVSRAGLARGAVERVRSDVAAQSMVALGAVWLLLLLRFRRASRALVALAPVAVGLVWAWGGLGWLDQPVDLVSLGAFALVAGLGVDYGVFLAEGGPRGAQAVADARSGVRLAAATTLVGFGALLVAHSPVMRSLGTAVVLGLTGAYLTAELMLPTLFARFGAPPEGPAPRRGRGLRFQLTLVTLLAGGVVLSWLTGARITHGWQVLAALAVDMSYGAWLIFKLRGLNQEPPADV
jgi:predicted exporter